VCNAHEGKEINQKKLEASQNALVRYALDSNEEKISDLLHLTYLTLLLSNSFSISMFILFSSLDSLLEFELLGVSW
jgi:hypothetical protein